MRKAKVFLHNVYAGDLVEVERETKYLFVYTEGYAGDPISLTMPVAQREYEFNSFPPVFDGVLPEGVLLEGLLRACKLDRRDCFGQLIVVGADLVGAITIEKQQ